MTDNADIVDINGNFSYCGVRDLTFTATANDQKTYLSFFNCSGIDVENCTFQPWSRIQADTLDAVVRLAKNDSIGIKLTSVSGMKVIIRENMFAALDCSLYATCQDVIFEDNYVYGFNGTNDWPATSVFYTGAQIVIDPGIYGSGEGFNSMNNLFVTGTHPAYAVINPLSITNFCSYNDRFESIYFGALVEGGTTWTFINPTEGGTQISESLGLIAYNTTNWTSWYAPSNYISSGSVRLHNGMLGYDSGNFKYGGTVTASNYVGSGSGLTFTNGNGARFKIGVNTTTNGLTFIPQ